MIGVYVPGRQLIQVDEFVEEAYFPAEQFVQDDAPGMFEKVPAKQLEQVETP